MSVVTYEQLRATICPACWAKRYHEEAGVKADLRADWQLLLIDDHFKTHDTASKEKGGHCDAVAVWPQQSNDDLRLIELKQSLEDHKKAKFSLKLIRTGEFLAAKLPNGLTGVELQAEIHVGSAPTSTAKFLKYIDDVAGRRVPLRAFRDGKQV